MKLDVRTAAAAALPAGKIDQILWDDDLPGFGLRLRAGGHRSWVVQYRAANRTRRATLGAAAKLTPADARQAARAILAKVTLGHDPQAEKAAERRRAARTVCALVADYLEAKQAVLRPASYRVTKLYLTGPYFASLQALAVTAVTRADVASAVRGISRAHSMATAAAARRALSAFFAWCIAEGELGNGANPVDGSHRPDDPTPHDRVLSHAELAAIWRACGDDEPGKIIRLLMLLGSLNGLPDGAPRRLPLGGVGGEQWVMTTINTGPRSVLSHAQSNISLGCWTRRALATRMRLIA
jgi:integrase